MSLKYELLRSAELYCLFYVDGFIYIVLQPVLNSVFHEFSLVHVVVSSMNISWLYMSCLVFFNIISFLTN